MRPRPGRCGWARCRWPQTRRWRASRHSRSRRRAPAMQPAQASTFLRMCSGTSPRVTMSETAKRPPGFSTRNASFSTRSLSRGQVDDAVRDDDIDGVVGERDGLDLAFQKLDVLDARLLLVFAGERQHLVRHVEAVSFARGADAARGKQHVDAAARAQVEDGLARPATGRARWGCRSRARQAPPLRAARPSRRRRRDWR